VVVLACKITGFWMLITVFEVILGSTAGVDSGPLPVSFVVSSSFARVDAYAQLSSVWGCSAECGAVNLSTGVHTTCTSATAM